ncbi:hypothetical protein PCANC_18167 [Puccinia coronata f. sp. avenae]|uniref:Uncharacterized protein n=1 Tax=Puccinia coronata f. sp. avenae TaxID=200324 RepID=A0A2N5SHI3_9BASI|nr:hypothetical protein PCANC_18167 [Puccinia coronata f. sp. avenae]
MLDSMPDILCIPVTRLAFPDQLQIFPTRKSLAFQGSQLKTASKSTEDEQAAKRDAERVRQLQQLAEVASRHSASDQPSVHKLSSSVVSPSPARPISSANRYSEPSGSPIAPLLSSNYATPKTYSLTLMGLEEINQLATEPVYSQDHGIAPSENQLRATLVALESNRSTPVPRPVEKGRETSIDPSPYIQVALWGREISEDAEMLAQDKLTLLDQPENRALFPQGG